MKIFAPRITEANGRTTASARIEISTPGLEYPQELYFSTRSTGSPMLSDKADAFVTAALPVAMRLGEPLDVEGPVSLRLAHGLGAYQDILTTWWPKRYRRVGIQFETLEARQSDARPSGVGCCFSGGLDSFQAVADLRMPAVRFPEYQITHALMINGFDQIMDLDHQGTSQKMYDAYQPALAQWGVDLMMIDTNLKLLKLAVMTRGQLSHSFGGSLTACAHALSPVFGRFCLSGHATYAHADLKPDGSHPVLDHHLSTDQMQVIHSGGRISRTRKLEALADDPVVCANLRVCFREPRFDAQTGAAINCGQCEKCVRTIVSLHIMGKPDSFTTFPYRPPLGELRDVRLLARTPIMFLNDLIDLARRKQESAWEELLSTALRRRKAALDGQASGHAR
ncbi:MAG: hypothetical protein HKN15_08835 [Xanthomonadales bacterium]|nr:hypothetical protein [Xanthomonadales bacterium]